ncbi:unnamed protein product [Rotaria sordida]|uniref:Uncharacterized protein n=1 Tax=Rotaria sordida TaxID=392033 RepID=A0A819EHD5_9BILA|nr:unnamed protein product [Rotaria sordida]
MNILYEENSQLRFIFSACMSPEDVHKHTKRKMDQVAMEYNTDSCNYLSLTHIMYFIYFMHHDEPLTLKISQATNDILIRTHDEYNNIVIVFQRHDDTIYLYLCSAELQLRYLDIVEYITISPEIAQTAVELMKFYIDTKILLYGFPLIIIIPLRENNIVPSVAQQISIT